MNSWLRSTRAGLSLLKGFWRKNKVVGHLDEIRHGAVRGWAWSPDRPGQRLLVDVFVEGRFAGQCLANLYRPDLEDAGIGDGRYAFQLNLAPEIEVSEQTVRVIALRNGRHELRRAPQDVVREKRLGPEAYLRATFSASIASRPLQKPRNRASVAGQRAYDRLFASSPAESPPAILGRPLTAYLDHVRHRHDLTRKYDTTLSEDEYAAFLKYYVEHYSRQRGRLRAPMPARDIALLNEGPTKDAPLANSLAQRLLQTAPDASGEEKLFLWAAFESATYGVEDCLIPEPQKIWLGACETDDAKGAFPLSRFMRRYLSSNSCLKRLASGGEEERKLAYLAMLLFATTAPHFLGFMPSAWVERFLAGSNAPFDETLRRVFGQCDYTRDDWRACFSKQGFDIEAKRFCFMSPHGDRLLSPAVLLSDCAAVDVQLIGPFSRRLGISDSCRALARALEKLDVSTRFCDFTLDHPNAARVREETPTADFGLARVNILHLNLEETPAAFAYLPDIFTGSHVVGMPYLETPRLGASQLLGLSLLDEIWAASRFIADAIAAREKTHIVGAACRPVQPIGRASARRRAYDGIASAEDFVFLTACDALSGGYRKNPLGVIRAFLHAFPDDANVKLVVKTHSLSRVGDADERRLFEQIAQIASQSSRIVWMDRFLEDADHSALLEGADTLVSLHRAEGFGYHILEAMTLGTPVIATAYSGNMEFCDNATARLIPYALANIEHGQYHRASASQTWAEPDFAASVAAMRHLREDSVSRDKLAADAKAYVEAHFSLDAFARRVDRRLQEILSGQRNRQVA
ncbi:glycosyltransferase family 4 protein [Methylocystis parvus]|nr:glycosyltransferase family 4 protein [Methylocystis parvus]WBK00083.1 glycosyltransferase family 4 protein [Methylocystis parvus OBBP]